MNETRLAIGLRIAVRNEAVALRRGAWLTDLFRDKSVATGVELVPVETGYPRDGVARIPGRSEAATSSLWKALRDDTADAAWLDLRELPRTLPEDIRVVAWTERLNPRAGLAHREDTPFKGLPKDCKLTTVDAVARAQIATDHPDIEWITLPGDLPTRLHKVHLRQADGALDAAADLLILGFGERAIEFMSTDDVLPPPCQGIWGVCVRADRDDLAAFFAHYDNEKAHVCGMLERKILNTLDPEVDAPVGVLVRAQRKKLLLDAATVPTLSRKVVRLSVSGASQSGDDLATALADMMRQRGVGRKA